VGALDASSASLAPLERTPLPPKALGVTRVAALTLDTAPVNSVVAAPSATDPTDPAGSPLSSGLGVPAAPLPTGAAPRRNALVWGGLALAVAVAALLVVRSRPPVQPVAAVVEVPIPPPERALPELEPPPERPAVPPVPPEFPAPTVHKAIEKPVAAPPPKVRPALKGPTRAQLDARLSAFEKKLLAHEKKLGDKDALLRGQLARARDEARVARSTRELTEAERRVASREGVLR
jgi:hypothetical protein